MSTISSSINHPLPTSPWKAWSIPIDELQLRRQLTGLLNQVTARNFDVLADKIVQRAIIVQRGGDSHKMDILAQSIFRRGITEELHVSVYANLCQKIIDELEVERTRWRAAGLYHLGNPLHPFETAIQISAQRTIHRVLDDGYLGELSTLCSFLGELLVQDILFPSDVRGLLETLFLRSEKNNEAYTMALCQFLNRVIQSSEASSILTSLSVIQQIEAVLEEDTISLKIRYLMMNMLDKTISPRPRDAFASVGDRTDVYGLSLDEEFNTVLGDTTTTFSDQLQSCEEHTHSLLLSRRMAPAEHFLNTLPPGRRHLFIRSLVAAAVSSNDISDASLVGNLFSSSSFQALCHPGNCFIDGFNTEVTMLADTVLDAPQGYRLMAIMLHACRIGRADVEEMASRIVIWENTARDRLLEEYLRLERHHAPNISLMSNEESDEEKTASAFERLSSSPDVGYAI